MSLILEQLQQRQATLTDLVTKGSLAEPARFARNHVFLKDAGTGVYLDSQAKLEDVDERQGVTWWTVSTVDLDREGDVLIPPGCLPTLKYYRGNPVVFFNHQQDPFPIGQSCDRSLQPGVDVLDNRIRAGCKHDDTTPTAGFVQKLAMKRILRATSISFVPIIAEKLSKAWTPDDPEQAGRTFMPRFKFPQWDMVEWSICGVGVNPSALRDELSKAKALDRNFAMLNKAFGSLAEKAPVWAHGWTPSMELEAVGEDWDGSFKAIGELSYASDPDEPLRWNKAWSKAFDVARQELDPASMFYDWASQYLETPVKNIHTVSHNVYAVQMGNTLTGLRKMLALEGFALEDVRRMGEGTESPPEYQSVQLNSKLRDSFLVKGTAFYRGKSHGIVIEHTPYWGGVELTFNVPAKHAQVVDDLLRKTADWVEKNNFLRGEKFSLSGEFLSRTEEDWGDLFLDAKNEKAVRRVLDRMNAKGREFPNHGMILSGPPGTGKTLACRILLNKADATYIWISAKDFYRFGSFGGMSEAFDMAKQLAPAILVFEDADNWMDRHSIDYLKSEMDGVARSKGLLTIITTNFPETLPEALIDRPGRFHDVCQFSLPAADERRKMLAKWVQGLTQEHLVKAVAETEGYSGAHLYHLAKFAVTLQETEDCTVEKSVELAIQKTAEQRDLITGIQLEGSRYVPSKAIQALVKGKVMSKTAVKPQTVTVKAKHIQSVRLFKAQFPEIEKARAWLKSHGYDGSVVASKPNSWDFAQRDAEPDARTLRLDKGVVAVLVKAYDEDEDKPKKKDDEEEVTGTAETPGPEEKEEPAAEDRPESDAEAAESTPAEDAPADKGDDGPSGPAGADDHPLGVHTMKDLLAHDAGNLDYCRRAVKLNEDPEIRQYLQDRLKEAEKAHADLMKLAGGKYPGVDWGKPPEQVADDGETVEKADSQNGMEDSAGGFAKDDEEEKKKNGKSAGKIRPEVLAALQKAVDGSAALQAKVAKSLGVK